MTLHGMFFTSWEGGTGRDLLHFGSRSSDFLDDLLDRCRPDKGLGRLIPTADECVDRLLQVRYAHEAAAANGLVGEFPEPALHQVQPARAGRNEVANKARVLLQPTLNVRLFVR